MRENHYPRLIIMVVLSFIAMYILMYSMVNIFGNVYNNFNQFYMAGLMAAPMLLIELVVMWSMYSNKRLNLILIVVSLIALVGFFLAIRQQAAVSDRQFLRSMIPHHAGAILMCERASLQDPETQNLCNTIISSQQSEIDQMKRILQRLDK
jgi:peptidoglycan/LPS O-acetylase OafA/YrhL